MKDKIQIDSGVTGEFYVAAELTKRGYIASLTSKNTKAIDMLASRTDGSKVVAIQIKTAKNGTSFPLNKKDELIKDSDSLFYIFVNLNISQDGGKIQYGPIDYYIVPMKKVKHYITSSHQKWLNSLGKNGKPHQDGPLRKYDIQPDDKLNNFELLGLDIENDLSEDIDLI